jgi:hypothetical protein
VGRGLHEGLVRPWERGSVEARESRGVVIVFGPTKVKDLDGRPISTTGDKPLGAIRHESFGGGPWIHVVLVHGVEWRGSAQVLKSAGLR